MTTNQTIPEQTHAALIALGWKPSVVEEPKQKDGLGEEHFDGSGWAKTTQDGERYTAHMSAFPRLVDIAIRSGGRYGMPDKEWGPFESVRYDNRADRFEPNPCAYDVFPTFHFPVGKAKDFLAEPGVDSHLRDFFFIVSGK